MMKGPNRRGGDPSRPGEQNKYRGSAHDTRYVLRKLAHYIGAHKGGFILALALTFLSNALALVGPMLSGYAIDAITEKTGVNFPRVFYYAGWMLVFYVISGVLSYGLSALMVTTTQKIVRHLRQDLFTSISRLPIAYTDSHATGDIISKISYDIDTVSTSLSTDVVQILSSVITVFGSFAMMLKISPALSLIFVFTIPTSMFLSKKLTSRTRPLFRARSRSLGELNGYVEETVSGLKTITAYHQEDTMIGRFDDKNEQAVTAYFKADFYSAYIWPLVNCISNLSLSLISVFGALMCLNGTMSLGQISSFVLYSRKFSGPINEAANIIAELQSAFAAGERVFRLIDEKPEVEDRIGAKPLARVQGDVRFDHVKFGYTPDKVVLHDLSMHAAPGSVTAIVGPTGAGKTTIVNLLMRFYDPQAGRILLDGKDLLDITRGSLRKSFAMVLQDTWLFDGTVTENIAYGSEHATLEDVQRVARKAKIHHFIEQLPKGYDTMIRENGSNISKGQKQLLTIARAMLQNAQMLILDEATSNVDTQTELLIQDAMVELMRGKTCFIIAHRLSTIVGADNILVVRDGDVVEQGTHEQLMAKGGFYKQLYAAQFEGN
jgi:ATP-binding cassette subfamily B multidrug efflux pump